MKNHTKQLEVLKAKAIATIEAQKDYDDKLFTNRLGLKSPKAILEAMEIYPLDNSEEQWEIYYELDQDSEKDYYGVYDAIETSHWSEWLSDADLQLELWDDINDLSQV